VDRHNARVNPVKMLRRAAEKRRAEVARAFPDAELGPEPCMYRGGTDYYPRTRNTGWLVLTPTTLVVRPLVGLEVKVPIADITGTRVEKSFNTHWNGKPVLVLETARGEVGITVRALERWRAALVR
jgi:hypothetical protein